MRELIYLSERKLRQFRFSRRRRLVLREIAIPWFGQVGVELSATSHFDAVIAHLERTARWYEEDVPVGQWVHFEALLGHRVLSSKFGPTVLLFAEPRDSGAGRRLVLHGAPDHLLGHTSEPISVSWGDMPDPHASFSEVLRPLMAHLSANAADGIPVKPRNNWEVSQSSEDLANLMAFLDEELDPDTAAWMGGYARVTMNTTRRPVVVASPLFVEFVTPPEDQ